MGVLFDYCCPKSTCGHKFEELVDESRGEHPDHDITCPKCGTVAKRVKVSKPGHGKHSSWPVH